jgi:transposase
MYESDVTAAEWGLIQAYFQPTDKRGAEPRHSKGVANAIFYLGKTGCQWRTLPGGFPPWQTVYDHWRRWNRRGARGAMLDALNGMHRKKTAGGPRRVTALSIRKAARRPTTATRRRKAASAISVVPAGHKWTRPATWPRCWCMPPTTRQQGGQARLLGSVFGRCGLPRGHRRVCRSGIAAQAAHFAKDQGRFCRPDHALDRGTDICLVGQLPAVGQGL